MSRYTDDCNIEWNFTIDAESAERIGAVNIAEAAAVGHFIAAGLSLDDPEIVAKLQEANLLHRAMYAAVYPQAVYHGLVYEPVFWERVKGKEAAAAAFKSAIEAWQKRPKKRESPPAAAEAVAAEPDLEARKDDATH